MRICSPCNILSESTATLRLKLFSEIENAGEIVIDDGMAGLTQLIDDDKLQEGTD